MFVMNSTPGRQPCIKVLVLLALITAGCGAHLINSKPPGAEVFVFPGGKDHKPQPEQMISLNKQTPFRLTTPSEHWYQVQKVGYAPSEIIYLPSSVWSGVQSHNFELKPAASVQPVAAKPARKRFIIAIFDIEDVTGQLKQTEISQIQDFLETRLAELGSFNVVPREQLRERLRQEKTDSYRACYNEACQIELGKEVAAEKSLATQILKVGNTCVVTSKIFDLKTATSEKAASARVACNPQGLLDGIDQIAKQLSEP